MLRYIIICAQFWRSLHKVLSYSIKWKPNNLKVLGDRQKAKGPIQDHLNQTELFISERGVPYYIIKELSASIIAISYKPCQCQNTWLLGQTVRERWYIVSAQWYMW
jgi:hypothetical protein